MPIILVKSIQIIVITYFIQIIFEENLFKILSNPTVVLKVELLY